MMKKNRMIILCVLVSGIILVSGFVFIDLISDSTPSLIEPNDVLYPISSLIYAQIDDNMVLAQDIDYEISPVGNNTFDI